LDEAFKLTNHINEPWWDNEKVEALVNSRSTSVGDVIVMTLDTGEVEHWRCDPIGWTEIDEDGKELRL
jgi:hypothetical protein